MANVIITFEHLSRLSGKWPYPANVSATFDSISKATMAKFEA